MGKYLQIKFKSDEDYENAIGILDYNNVIEYHKLNKTITVNESEIRTLYVEVNGINIPFLKFVNDEEVSDQN